MNKQDAKSILESRSVINSAGKYTVKVTHVTKGYVTPNGRVVDIVNFSAMTGFQASKALQSFKAGEYAESTDRTGLSTSVLDRQYCPSKGEIVDIEVSDHFSENVGENILVVSSIIKRQAEKASKFSLDFEDDDNSAEPAVDVIKAASKESALV